MAFAMVSHAIRMLFSNFGDALKVSLVPFLILLGISLGSQVLIFGEIQTSFEQPFDPMEVTDQFGARSVFVQFLVSIASFVLSAWIAVGWHRFVLAEEYPSGFVPPFRSSEILLYIWKLILITLAAFAMSLPLIIFGSLLFGFAGGGDPSPVMVLVFGLAVLAFVIFIMLAVIRWSVMLPAASIGRSMSFRQAWDATAPLGAAPLLAFILLALFMVVMFAVTMVTAFVPLLFAVTSAAVNLIATLLGVSMATTIYGVAVEGRELT